MKTKLKYCLSELTGTVDDLVLYRNRKTGKLLARRYCVPKPSAENTRMAETSRNLFALAPSEAYKADLKLYLLLHNELSHKPFHGYSEPTEPPIPHHESHPLRKIEQPVTI